MAKLDIGYNSVEKAQFIETRQRGLKLFLTKLLKHPEMHLTKELYNFLKDSAQVIKINNIVLIYTNIKEF